MDIDGQSDDDHRFPLSDEHEQNSPLSSNFVGRQTNLSNRNSHSDRSYSSSGLNESCDESNLSLNELNDDDEENLPAFLTNDD